MGGEVTTVRRRSPVAPTTGARTGAVARAGTAAGAPSGQGPLPWPTGLERGRLARRGRDAPAPARTESSARCSSATGSATWRPSSVADLRELQALGNHLAVALQNARRADLIGEQAAETLHRSLHDTLTGLPNRRGWRTACASTATDEDHSVVLLNLDRFKEINDTLGHPAGDALLAMVAARLRRAAPESAVLARRRWRRVRGAAAPDRRRDGGRCRRACCGTPSQSLRARRADGHRRRIVRPHHHGARHGRDRRPAPSRHRHVRRQGATDRCGDLPAPSWMPAVANA